MSNSVGLLGTDQHDKAVANITGAVARAQKKRAVTTEFLINTTAARRSLPPDSELAKALHELARRHVRRPTKSSSALARAVLDDIAADLIDDRAPSRLAPWRTKHDGSMRTFIVSADPACQQHLGLLSPAQAKREPNGWRQITFDGTCVVELQTSTSRVVTVEPFELHIGKGLYVSGTETKVTTETYKTNGAGDTQTYGGTTYSSSCSGGKCTGSTSRTSTSNTYSDVAVIRRTYRRVEAARSEQHAQLVVNGTFPSFEGGKHTVSINDRAPTKDITPILPGVRARIITESAMNAVLLYDKRYAALRAKKKTAEALDLAVYATLTGMASAPLADIVRAQFGTAESLELLALQRSIVPVLNSKQRVIEPAAAAAAAAAPTPAPPTAPATKRVQPAALPQLASTPAPEDFAWEQAEANSVFYYLRNTDLVAERVRMPCGKDMGVIGRVGNTEMKRSRRDAGCYSYGRAFVSFTHQPSSGFRSPSAATLAAAKEHLLGALASGTYIRLQFSVPKGVYAWYEP